MPEFFFSRPGSRSAQTGLYDDFKAKVCLGGLTRAEGGSCMSNRGFRTADMEPEQSREDKNRQNALIIDRGLARSGTKVHGVNPALLIEKILRERILDAHYWHLQVSQLGFYEVLDECVESVVVVGTYVNASRSKACKFVVLLFRLLQFEVLPEDVVEWLICGEHGFKYLSVLFMVYARLMWEDQAKLWMVLEAKLDDYRRVRLVENGVVRLSHVDEIAESLLERDKFVDMAMPRLVNRWVLEEQGVLEERESALVDEFEQELDNAES